ncbi:MAG: LysR family transcriptional regulator, partial [Gammaproteobacteria bacterium]
MSEAIIETSAGRIAAPGMQDLNDLYLFTLVVEKGSFTAASRAAALTTSRISRRIADLEERLGVRLLAAEVVEHIQASPRGRVRVTCPTLTAQSLLGEIITDFIERYPEVGVTLAATDRLVDLIDEGFDVAIRFRNTPLEESNLVARTLGESRSYLVASPAVLERHGHPQQPGELSRLSSLGKSRHDAAYAWHLTHADGRSAVIPFRPLLDSDDWVVIKQAALAGLGVAAIPGELCHEEITEGTLNIVLPDWNLPGINLYLLYTSRRGLIPAVRAFIDFAAERLAYSCKVQAQNMRST